MTSRSSRAVIEAVLRGGLSPYVTIALVVAVTYQVAYTRGAMHGAITTGSKYRKFLRYIDEQQRIASMN